MILFLLLPVVVVLLLSFVKWNFLQPPSWAGFSNFVTMTRDDHVFHALLISAYYVLWNIPVADRDRARAGHAAEPEAARHGRVPRPVRAALHVHPGGHGRGLGLAVRPAERDDQPPAVPGRHHGPDWLGDQATALPVVADDPTWQYVGYNMLFFLAGLQAIPPQLYEAAGIDGASAWGSSAG